MQSCFLKKYNLKKRRILLEQERIDGVFGGGDLIVHEDALRLLLLFPPGHGGSGGVDHVLVPDGNNPLTVSAGIALGRHKAQQFTFLPFLR